MTTVTRSGASMTTVTRSGAISATVTRGAAFSPSDLGDKLLEWLVADDLTGIQNSVVTTWTGRNDTAFTQADADKKPLLNLAAAGINGRQSVLFDGTDDLLAVASAFTTTASGAIYIVCRHTAPIKNAAQSLWSSGYVLNTNYYLVGRSYLSAGLARLVLDQKNNDTADKLYGNTNMIATTPFVAGWESDGSTSILRFNGAAETLTVSTGANNGDWFGDTLNRDHMALGCRKRFAEDEFFKGDIAEIVFCASPLTTAERGALHNYFSHKYTE